MLLILLPLHGASLVIGEHLPALPFLAPTISLGLAILVCDVALYFIIRVLIWKSLDFHAPSRLPHRLKESNNFEMLAMVFHWFSPLVIFCNYIEGQLDVIPLLGFAGSILALEQRKFAICGFLVGFSILCKLNFLMVVPFLGCYLIYVPIVRTALRRFAATLGVLLFLYALSLWAAPGQILVLLGNAELSSTLAATFLVADSRPILVFPLIFGCILLYSYFTSPLDRTSLYLILASMLIAVVSVSAASIAWYMWSIPVLLMGLPLFSYKLRLLILVYWSLAIFVHLYENSGMFFDEFIWNSSNTALFGVSILLSFRLINQKRFGDIEKYLSDNKAIVIIGGDSGAGKSFWASQLVSFFQPHNCVELNGDNYHKYSRDNGIWKVLSHLNPKANDLTLMAEDLRGLHSGRGVTLREYDHSSGMFLKPKILKSRPFIIVNGLHALLMSKNHEGKGFCIYLEPAEQLRQSLKIARDVGERGKSEAQVVESIEQREADRKKYIMPQAALSDLVIRQMPTHQGVDCTDGLLLSQLHSSFQLKVQLEVSNDLPLEEFVQAVTIFSNVHIRLTPVEGDERTTVEIFGPDATAETVTTIANNSLKYLHHFAGSKKTYGIGNNGLVLVFIIYCLERQFIKESLYA